MIHRRVLTALALTAALSAAFVAGCGKKESGSQASKPAATTKAPASSTAATPAARPPVKRDTPEAAAASIRSIASTSFDPAAIKPFLDPSQSEATSKILAPMLIYYSRLADLRRAANESFGAGAGDMVASSASYTVDFGNGVREMFDAHHFEDVRRDGGKAYVMATLEDGQPIGAPIVFKEHQGEWLLLLCDGDDPWPASRLNQLATTLAGPLQGAISAARTLESHAAKVRSGEIKTLDELLATMAPTRQG